MQYHITLRWHVEAAVATNHTHPAFQSYQEGPFFTGKLASLQKHASMMLHMAEKDGTEP
jgi:hypothetical protein